MSFCKYDLNYLKNISSFEYFVSCSPKNLIEIIKDKFNPDKDIVLCNSASTPSYLFYSNKLGFYTDNIFEMPITSPDKETVFNYLNGLENGRGYWFYLIKDYNNFKLYPQIFDWLALLNMNVWVILILIVVVAGFNMVSGLLILIRKIRY